MKNKSKLICFVFFILALQSNINAQVKLNAKFEFKQKLFAFESRINEENLFLQNSNDDTLYIKKRFWRAAGELMIAQVIPWSYNYFVRDAEFARITWESIWYNMHFKNWVWDDNTFQTNQFAHPYHGSLYYSAFRTNGYSFWESVPAAFAGSYIWEVAGETHPASPNDLLNTSLGGISLGEMTYRFSNLIVNNKQTGFKRQANEVLAFLVNPMNGLNRIIDGRWGRVMANPKDRVPAFLSGTVDAGYRRYSNEIEDVFTKGENEFYVRANIQYGNPFEDFEKPFSNFSLTGELGASDSATLNNVQVVGGLYSNVLKDNEKVNKLMTVTMNYDYIKNTSIQFGGQSFSLKIMSDHKRENNSHIYIEAGIIGVVIAAVPDDYLSYGEGRNYDFGSGGGVLLGTKINLKDKFWVGLNYKGIWFHTINGNPSDFFINTLVGDLRYFLTEQFSLTTQAGYIVQNSNYEDFDDTVKKYPYGRIGVGYTLGSK